jgi:hypothetical protein
MHAVLWVMVVLMLELVVGLILLGTWIAEGRRRAEEIERLAHLADLMGRAQQVPDPAERST